MLLALSIVVVCGLALGRLRVRGVGLGAAGVLFAGLFWGHWNLGATLADAGEAHSASAATLEFVRDFGLMLFVYTLGLQVGPGFWASLRRQGLALNALAAATVLMGAIVTLIIARAGHIPMAAAVGIFSGATTNTPSLAAAQQALTESGGATQLPGLGYAVAYPGGVAGVILTIILARTAFRMPLQSEKTTENETPPDELLRTVCLDVSNPNLNGMTLEKLPVAGDGEVVVSRVLHNGNVQVAHPGTRVSTGDVVLAVGTQDSLDRLRTVIGHDSETDLRAMPSQLHTRWLWVTNRAASSKTLGELDWPRRFGLAVTRVARAEIEWTPRPDMRLQFGDALLCVGPESALQAATREAGAASGDRHHPDILTLFLGLALGVLLGSVPIPLPGVPSPLRLGLAGGPLLAALLLSRAGTTGPFSWHLPPGANRALREVGIALFLAAVGLKAGGAFIPTILSGGAVWMLWAIPVTLVPLAIAAWVAHRAMHLSFPAMCGLLAGSTTDPPALAFAQNLCGNDAPALTYATVYPTVMVARILAAQLLVLLFS
jgi:putative transport protein